MQESVICSSLKVFYCGFWEVVVVGFQRRLFSIQGTLRRETLLLL